MVLSRGASLASGIPPNDRTTSRDGVLTPISTVGTAPPGAQAYASLNVKQVTLTSKKNWWLGACLGLSLSYYYGELMEALAT